MKIDRKIIFVYGCFFYGSCYGYVLCKNECNLIEKKYFNRLVVYKGSFFGK